MLQALHLNLMLHLSHLSGDFEFLDLVQQDLCLTGGEVRTHRLQDAVEGFGDRGLEVPRMHLTGLVVRLEIGIGVVHHRALYDERTIDREKRREIRDSP